MSVTSPTEIRRLYILAEPRTPTAEDPREWVVQDGDDGLSQITDFARRTAAETGESLVCFEIFWPWESETSNTWDAVVVDVRKIDAADPADWWIETLPPYAEMTAAERDLIGIGDEHA